MGSNRQSKKEMPAHLLPASASLEMPPICHRPATAHNNLHCYYLCLQQHDPHGPHCHLLIKTFKLYRNIVVAKRESDSPAPSLWATSVIIYYLSSIIYYFSHQPSYRLAHLPLDGWSYTILSRGPPIPSYFQLLKIACVFYILAVLRLGVSRAQLRLSRAWVSHKDRFIICYL